MGGTGRSSQCSQVPPEPCWPLSPPGGAQCPSSERPEHPVHGLSLAKHTPHEGRPATYPPLPIECRPPRPGPGLTHLSVPGKYQRLKSSLKKCSTTVLNPRLEHLLPVFR